MGRGEMLLVAGAVWLSFGTFGLSSASPALPLETGKRVYDEKCAVCHGHYGKAEHGAAAFLHPKPRDLTAGKFKIRSTPSGSLPTDEDLLKTILNGIPGTSMPSWRSIPESERRALLEYIKTFDERFKTQPAKPISIGRPPAKTPQLLARGKQLYQDAGCFDCHGTTGQGDGPAAKELKDDWGNPITPYDFTKGGRYKAGFFVRDIYRTFTTGMAGTPMPSYEDSLAEDQRWALAYYVQSLSKRPRGPTAKEGATVISRFVEADLSGPDPSNRIWKRAAAVDILLRPLWFREGYVDRVRVRSLHNGKEIAFLLEWEDSTKNTDMQRLEPPHLVLARALKREHTKSTDILRLENFGDAAALQFPAKANGLPPFPMGQAVQVVSIWQWRADREGNGQGSAQSLAAAGFGTLTTQVSQDVKGNGIWKAGRWRVAFSRSTASAEEGAQFVEGKVMPVAFAIWDGAINQRDGEKSVSTWAFLKIEAPRR